MTTLETRRIRGDQIEVFKITHGIEGLDSGMFFKYRADNGTRGHSWALAKERCKLDIRKYAFSQRTINEWNRLPGECVNATSVNMFKNKIDNYFKRSGYVYMWANLSSGVDVVHATRQVCCPAEKTAGKKTTRLNKICVTFMQTRDMYLHFTRSNIWANGNN